jgi:hypothetical protein
MSNSYVMKGLSVMFLAGAIAQSSSAYADIVFGVAGSWLRTTLPTG